MKEVSCHSLSFSFTYKSCTEFYVNLFNMGLCCTVPWQVWLAKQETLTPPGHLVSPVVYRGPCYVHNTVTVHKFFHIFYIRIEAALYIKLSDTYL